MKVKIYIIITFILLVILVGCTKTIPTVVDSWIIPSPSTTTGVIFGTLLNSKNGEPINGSLYLSNNITYDQPELPPTISFSYQYNPRAKMDQNSGRFVFSEVEPMDNYVLTILLGLAESIIVKEDNGTSPMMIKLDAGESMDLGTIYINLP